MSEKKILLAKAVELGNGYNPIEVYSSLAEPDELILDIEERRMLDRVAIKYGQLNGKQLGELSHAEAPYVGTKPGEDISYELAFYRGTDFSDL
mgnify:FL=1